MVKNKSERTLETWHSSKSPLFWGSKGQGSGSQDYLCYLVGMDLHLHIGFLLVLVPMIDDHFRMYLKFVVVHCATAVLNYFKCLRRIVCFRDTRL